MGRYFRTVEMGRFARFACWICGGDFAEHLVGARALELTCAPDALVVRVDTLEPIPARALPPGATRYRPGEPLDHGAGFRCLNCARELLAEGKPPAGSTYKCQRCKTLLQIRSTSAPASASAASGSPAATPAFAARSS